MAKLFCSKVCCVAKYSSIDFLLTAVIRVRMFKTSFRYSMTILACASNPTFSRSWQTTSYGSSLNSFDKVSTWRFKMHRFIDPSFGVIFFNFINAQNDFFWTYNSSVMFHLNRLCYRSFSNDATNLENQGSHIFCTKYSGRLVMYETR